VSSGPVSLTSHSLPVVLQVLPLARRLAPSSSACQLRTATKLSWRPYENKHEVPHAAIDMVGRHLKEG
jgi:hypothetical protein